MIVFLSVLVFVLCVWAIAASVYTFRFAKLILNVEERIGESLDVLEEAHDDISKILEIPVMTDDPQTRQVISCIKRSRDAVLHVARGITTINNETERDE